MDDVTRSTTDDGMADVIGVDHLSDARLISSIWNALDRSGLPTVPGQEPAPEQDQKTDRLTGLFDRNLFFELLDRDIAAARRTRSSVGVVRLDLNDFQAINRTMGRSELCILRFLNEIMFSESSWIKKDWLGC